MVDIVVLDIIAVVVATCSSGFVSGLGLGDVGKPNLNKKTLCVRYFMPIRTETCT